MGDSAYKQRHREQGLCVCCSRPSRLGHSLCLEHLQLGNVSKKASVKRRRAIWKKENKCSICGTPLHPEMDANRMSCLFCRGGF